MENNKALVKQPDAESLVVAFEQHAVAARKIQDIAIQNTLPSDWVSFGGKAWLDAPGAERVARAIGLSVRNWTHTRDDMKDDEGNYYIITCTGQVGHKQSDLWIDAVGVQWSRKPFFYKEGDRHKTVGEIHPGNIIKDAFSDMYRNGVTRLLGLRGLPWSYLKELGIKQETAQKVDFERGKRGGKSKPNNPPAGEDPPAQKHMLEMLAKTACKRVIGTSQESIADGLPDNLKTSQVNVLLKYIAELPGEIEAEEWAAKVKEVSNG